MCCYLTTNDLVYGRMKYFVQHQQSLTPSYALQPCCFLRLTAVLNNHLTGIILTQNDSYVQLILFLQEILELCEVVYMNGYSLDESEIDEETAAYSVIKFGDLFKMYTRY